MEHKKKQAATIRLIVQIFFFSFIFLVAIATWLEKTGITIPLLAGMSLHAICPFGGVVTIYEFATVGDFIQKIHSSAFILMILAFVSAILFGAIFCGYICPFGSFQEWIGKLGKKLFPKKYNRMVPPKLDRILRYLRYVVLIMVVYQTAISAKLIFQDVDPYYALFNFFTSEVAISAYIVLGVMTVLSLFIERPWLQVPLPIRRPVGSVQLRTHF